MRKILLVIGLVVALVGAVSLALGPRLPSRSSMAYTDFGEHRIKVFFAYGAASTDCSEVRGYSRRTFGSDVLHDAMNHLLRGPRDDEAGRGAWSFFSHRTAGLVNRVRIRSGVAYIDFDDFRSIIPGASSSCGSSSLLAQLDKTAKQFPRVLSTRYSFEGNRSAFYEWLQISAP